jgi:hypothetical protein
MNDHRDTGARSRIRLTPRGERVAALLPTLLLALAAAAPTLERIAS